MLCPLVAIAVAIVVLDGWEEGGLWLLGVVVGCCCAGCCAGGSGGGVGGRGRVVPPEEVEAVHLCAKKDEGSFLVSELRDRGAVDSSWL